MQSGGLVTVNGQYNGAVLLDSKYHVELYRLAPDLSGYGEGRTYLGAYDVQWNIQGDTTWHIRDPRGQCCFDVFLPAVLKQ